MKRSVLDSYGITDYTSLNWTKTFGNLGPDDVMDEATYRLWEIVDHLEIRSIDEDPHSNQKIFGISEGTLDYSQYRSMIIDRIHPKYGRCFTLNPSVEMKSLGINSVKIAKKSGSNINLRIFLHVDDLFWDATNRQMGYLMQELETATTQVKIYLL